MYKIGHYICQISNITCQISNIIYSIANSSFSDKSAFEFGLRFLSHIGLFSNFAFSVVFGETLLPKGAYRPWDHFSLVGKTLLGIVNYLQNIGF